MAISNLSLKGLVVYLNTEQKKGISITPKYRMLKDLEIITENMYNIRDGSSDGCSGHGGDTQGDNLPKTECAGHSKIYNNTDLSLKQFETVFEAMTKCTCDSNSVNGCFCISQCTCDCNSDCCVGDCCVGNCSCNSN